MGHFQFWALQLIIVIGAFSKRGVFNKGEMPPAKRLKSKSFLFLTEGILLLAIAWIWKHEPDHLSVYYLVGGIFWILTAGITYLYAVRRSGHSLRS